MKCQKCDRPATFHITELTGGKPVELHLCEDHAREYLTQSSNEPASASTMAAALAHQLAQQMAVGQTAEELAKLDQQSCPVCGITFHEFRNQGRLTDLLESGQLCAQIGLPQINPETDRAMLCGSPALGGNLCLEHLIAARERARTKTGARKRNHSLSYRLEKAAATAKHRKRK